MRKLKTTLRTYRFDLREPGDLSKYEALLIELQGWGLECFESHGGEGHYAFVKDISGREIELETDTLFGNQWNTAPIEGKSESGLRVFDWAQDPRYHFEGHNPYIKQGHYLEQTPEMSEVRHNRFKCGYCGHQTDTPDGEFHSSCWASPHCNETAIRLTRYRRVSLDRSYESPELTEQELEVVKPLYVQAQLEGAAQRQSEYFAKKRTQLTAARDKAIRVANAEHDGMMWLLDNQIAVDNAIYYSHINKFSFGWREPLSPDVAKALSEKLANFPFDYEIKSRK